MPVLAIRDGVSVETVITFDAAGDEDETLAAVIAASRPSVAAADVGALICSHETYAEAEWDSDRHFLRGIDFVHEDPPLIGDVGPDGARS